MHTDSLERARGALLGQLIGDALGSQVEGMSASAIGALYPHGLRDLQDGGPLELIAGQPTDDSEMALLLARSLIEHGTYKAPAVLQRYRYWLNTQPFSLGLTILKALQGQPSPESQANGALMRVSPLGIFGAFHSPSQVAAWAEEDARLTHVHPLCAEINALYAMAIAHAVGNQVTPEELYQQIALWAQERNSSPAVIDALEDARQKPPADYQSQMGWVLIAWQNALFQLLHAPDLETALVDTVMRGGDTDTNAAIAGALLGAVHGRSAIPKDWERTVLNCRPAEGILKVKRPRPACFWPGDALELARKLLESAAS